MGVFPGESSLADTRRRLTQTLVVISVAGDDESHDGINGDSGDDCRKDCRKSVGDPQPGGVDTKETAEAAENAGRHRVGG